MLKTKYKTVPILALTATATIKVKDDVCNRLRMKDLQCFQSSFNRPNLYYEVRRKRTPQHMQKDMLKLITDRYQNQSGIIYCVSRKDCETWTRILKTKGFSVEYYHAKLRYSMRKEVQAKWMTGEVKIILATVAFGLGINKPDVRFIIH